MGVAVVPKNLHGPIARSIISEVTGRVKAATWDLYDPSRRTGFVYERTKLVEHRNALDVCLYVELRGETSKKIYPDHVSA